MHALPLLLSKALRWYLTEVEGSSCFQWFHLKGASDLLRKLSQFKMDCAINWVVISSEQLQGVPYGVVTWVALSTKPAFIQVLAKGDARAVGMAQLQHGAQTQLFLLQPHHIWAQQHLPSGCGLYLHLSRKSAPAASKCGSELPQMPGSGNSEFPLA